jgi:hypothetical protein
MTTESLQDLGYPQSLPIEVELKKPLSTVERPTNFQALLDHLSPDQAESLSSFHQQCVEQGLLKPQENAAVGSVDEIQNAREGAEDVSDGINDIATLL